jgi:hybrid cluster-associated redox disulfide protein
MKDGNMLNFQMSVSDLLNDYPQAIPVFLNHHMACVGCSMSSFETLRDAARIYGIDPQEFMDELQQAIRPDLPSA